MTEFALEIEKIEAFLLVDGWHVPKKNSVALKLIGLKQSGSADRHAVKLCLQWQEPWPQGSPVTPLFVPVDQIVAYRYAAGVPL